MFDSSTWFGPTGPSSGASIDCVLLVWYVKVVCCSVRPYVRRLFHNHLTYGRTEQHTIFTYQTSNTQFVPPNVWTHQATHSLHIPNQQHTVYRCS